MSRIRCRKPYPSDIPEYVCSALDALSDEEVNNLTAFYSYETRTFLYVAIKAEDGRAMSPSSKEKLDALDVLSRQYLEESINRPADEMRRKAWIINLRNCP